MRQNLGSTSNRGQNSTSNIYRSHVERPSEKIDEVFARTKREMLANLPVTDDCSLWGKVRLPVDLGVELQKPGFYTSRQLACVLGVSTGSVWHNGSIRSEVRAIRRQLGRRDYVYYLDGVLFLRSLTARKQGKARRATD